MTDMYDMNAMMELLDDADRKNVLCKMQEYLKEKGCYQQQEENRDQEKDSKTQQWKIADRDGAPEDQQMLYLTVQEEGSTERELIEGSMEDGKWYNDDGVSLKAKGITVIAWLPKDVPELYLGDGGKS